MIRCLNHTEGDRFALYHGDCVDVISQLPDASIGFAIYSPPFSNLFVYSDAAADMGNCEDDIEFEKQYSFLCKQLARVMMPGRLVAVHCSDLPFTKWKDGVIGIKDFSGHIIRMHEAAGFVLHSRVTVWKDPVVEMTRTKALGLLYKQLRKDSTRSRQGMADYVCVFRAPGENAEPVEHTKDSFPLDQWQKWASPVWMDIQQTDTLNVVGAKDDKDERHICPLQLGLIRRAIVLWSNEGDTVLSPFAGIGSEGVCSMQLGRRFVGVELKDTYFQQASRYLIAESQQMKLFPNREETENV
jgi:DNA modification methylase